MIAGTTAGALTRRAPKRLTRTAALAALATALLASLLTLFGGQAGAASVAISATAADGGALAPTPGIPALSRDCGYSTRLSDGNLLWVFCDSFYASNTGVLHATVTNGAAFATPAAPTTPRDETYSFVGETLLNADAAQPGGRNFITLPATATFACAGGVRKAWPKGVTTVPKGGANGADRVLVYYARICDLTVVNGPNSFTDYGTGLAAYDYVPGSFNEATGPTTPTTATILNDGLFSSSAPWGDAAVTSLDGLYVYVYRCDSSSCYAGRVPVTQAATAASYQWWGGSSWGTTAIAMSMPGDSIPNSEFSVAWMPQVNKWVMTYTPCSATCLVSYNDRAHLRTAASPLGPWTSPVAVALPNCTNDGTSPCNSTLAHVEQSGAALTISYSRRTEGSEPPGRLHTATVPFRVISGLRLDSTTPELTSQTGATFTFSGSDVTFECALDAAAYAACTSPKTVSGLTSASHTFRVRSVSTNGTRSAPSGRTWTVDADAPTSTLQTAPPPSTTATTASFSFTGADRQSTVAELRYECTLDDGAAVSCQSPYTLSAVTPTSHTMAIRSIDRAGNRSTAVVANWTVPFVFTSATPPGATLSTPYTSTFTTNASTGVTYAVTSGVVPAGLTLSSGGVLGGTPTTVGRATTTVTATSSFGTASQSFTLTTIASISGTLRNAVTNAPAAGIRVRAFDPTGLILAEVNSGADGVYRIGGLRDASYRLEFFDPASGFVLQYGNGAATLAAAPSYAVVGGTTTTVDQSLAPLTTIAGKITDQVTGAAVVGAYVTLFDSTGASIALATTAGDGTYRFPTLPAATYRLGFFDPSGAHVPGYWSNATTLASATGIAAQGGTATANARLEPYTTVNGTVHDRSGNALGGIWVVMYEASGTSTLMAITAADGTYRIANLRMGSYRLSYLDTTGAHATIYWQGSATLAGATAVAAQGGTMTLDPTM